jgi:penicillin amidase
VSLPAPRLAELLVEHLAPAARHERMAVEALRGWDGRISGDSAAAAIYEVFRNELVRARFGESLDDLVAAVLGVGPHPLLAAVNSHYFLQTQRVLAYLEEHGVDDVARRAFGKSVQWLTRRLGPSVTSWQWGKLHPLRMEHALSIRKPLGMLFNVPPFPWSGDLETVRAGGSLPGTLSAGGPISAYRFIADCSDWDNSLSCVPAGQSGHRGSPHYADQVDSWRRVAYHPLAFTRPAVARVAKHTLTLRPT